MTAHHAYWRGYLKLSLLMFGVRLFAAVGEERSVHLHQLDRRSGKRIHYDKVAEGDGHVEAEDIVKGYEYEKGRYVQIEPDDIEQLKLPSTEMLEIAQFVDEDELDPVWFDKPYYLLPDGKVAEEPYKVLREALAQTRSTALGPLVIARRERVMALRPHAGGIVAHSLRRPEQLRPPEEYFNELDRGKPAREEVEMARELIKRKTAAFDPNRFVDHYETALRELVTEKVEGTLKKRPRPRAAPAPSNVVDLIDLLRRSLEADGGDAEPAERKRAGRPAKPRRRKSA
jgi:DNA end-binding protein Ku